MSYVDNVDYGHRRSNVTFVEFFLPLGLALWIWGIVDAAKRSNESYAKAGSNKTLWIVLIVLFGDLAVFIYAVVVRPKLVATEGQ